LEEKRREEKKRKGKERKGKEKKMCEIGWFESTARGGCSPNRSLK